MANYKYKGSPIYNYEIKQKFLNEYPKSEKYKDKFRLLFEKSFSLENEWGKDIANFSLFEIVDLMDKLNARTTNSGFDNKNLIKYYIKWSINNGIREDKDNPLNTVPKDWHLDFVYDTKDYLSKFEIDKIIERTINAQDAVILCLLFEGVSGKELWEIRSLRPENVNSDTGVLRVKNLDGSIREIKVSDKCLKLINSAYYQDEYIPKNGDSKETARRGQNFELFHTGFVIKPSKTNTQNFEQVDAHLIYQRLRTIADFFQNKSLQSVTKIQYSGMIWQGKLLYDKYKH